MDGKNIFIAKVTKGQKGKNILHYSQLLMTETEGDQESTRMSVCVCVRRAVGGVGRSVPHSAGK